MAQFCIPKESAERIKQYAIKGEVDISKLYLMSSKERRAMFATYTKSNELAKFLNAHFEQAMISRQKDALTQWAESVFKPKERKGEVFKSIKNRIEELNDLGVLSSDTFLEDIVAKKLGVGLTETETKIITEKATALQDLYEKIPEIGNPQHMNEHIAYFKKKKEMDDYLQSLVPQSAFKIFTSTIARGTMLFSFKSPFLNIESNSMQALLEGFGRRMANQQLSGKNGKLAYDYAKMVRKIYKESGYDISRILNDDIITGAGKTLGEEVIHSQGKGAVRKVGRFYEDYIFGKAMGSPDVAFSSIHFADSINIESTRLAKSLGFKGSNVSLKAREYMLDAMKIKPTTREGEIIREKAVVDATYATYTNKGVLSDFGLAIRQWVNKITGNARLGDQFSPFVKTPLNVVEAGLDGSGLGFLKAAVRLTKGVSADGLGAFKDPILLRKAARDAVRAGTGMTAAALIVSQIKPENFVGKYDPQRAQIDELKNVSYNAIKIGGKWISLDYFGPLAVPLTGMLYAKKYGGPSAGDKAYQYLAGVGRQFYRLPAFSMITNVEEFFADNPENKKYTAEEINTGLINGTIDFIRARTIPSFINDLAVGTDTYQRYTKEGKFDKLKASIPILRESLPIKDNAIGEQMKTEGFLKQFTFGARIKTSNENPIVLEIDRLRDAGAKPNIVDFKRSTRKDLIALKEQIGSDAYKEAEQYYKTEMRSSFDKLVKNKEYIKMSDEDKKKQMDNAVNVAIDKTLTKYKYKKPVTAKREQTTYIIK